MTDETPKLGDLMRERQLAYEEAAAHAKAERKLRERVKELEDMIKDVMNDLEIDTVHKDGYTASFHTSVVANVEDWDQVFDYVIEHKAKHMLFKRLLLEPLKEMYDAKESLPGAVLTPLTQLKIVKR